MHWDDVLAASFLATCSVTSLIVVFGITVWLLAPDLNTVTVHKQQDRLQLPCPDQGEGGH